MASEPAQEHSYIVDSFEEFEALARRALHEDLHTGAYLAQTNRSTCDRSEFNPIYKVKIIFLRKSLNQFQAVQRR